MEPYFRGSQELRNRRSRSNCLGVLGGLRGRLLHTARMTKARETSLAFRVIRNLIRGI
jgi:hypothetical protein